MTDPVASPVPAKSAIWEDFIDIFISPREVFERRRDGQFGMALLVLVVISTILFLALKNGLAPIMDAEMARGAAATLKANPNLTAEQVSQGQNMFEKFAVVGVAIFTPIAVLLTAAVLWLVSRLVDAKESFAAAMMIITYSQFPRVLATVVSAVQGLLLEPETIKGANSVSIGPGRFLDPGSANPFLLTLFSGLDLFALWSAVLVALGLSVVARIPMQRAAIAAALVWVATLLPALFGALRGS